eukprot:CAMPEP_0201589500 /NCGR_PEP_ID=MMETSP0190_2-20130828/167129_1 /ASSEMBLY_ACC=CAM_ASM_000263 /TAXON_ID=37353 /ORGANISM="Rosalina sp." /LENGTH=184 /DNA_ID=CAMNT_0048043731 /DNA_START=12 /DNA_END=566 /DNA_ORIENTATION=+
MGATLALSRCCGNEDKKSTNTQAMAKEDYYVRNGNENENIINSISDTKHDPENVSYSSLKGVPTPRMGQHLTAEPSLDAWSSGMEDEEWQTDTDHDTPSYHTPSTKKSMRKSELITKISYHSMRSLDQTENDMLEEMETLKSLTALRALSKDSNMSIASMTSMTTQSSTTPSPAYYDNNAINSH